jgi:hypothetical protein
MSEHQLDAQGEAHEALGTAVASYGQRVLNDPHILGNLVTDLLPDLPRERSLLVAGAETGVAAEIKQHVEEQHLDPDTAVQLVARALSERRAIDPAASLWVASEYSEALGYRVRPYTEALQSGQPQPIPTMQPQGIQTVPPTMTAVSGATVPTQPPPMAAPAGQVPQGPPAQPWPPSGQSWPPTQDPSSRPPASRNGRKRSIIAASAAAGVAVLYLIVAAVVHTAPFAKTSAAVHTTPPVRPSTHKPTPIPSPTLARSVAPLVQLLPVDISDPATECKPVQKPYQWSMPGVVQALDCTDPGLSNGFVDAYQMNNRADFETAWRNFDTWWPFDPSTAQQKCPPSSSSAQAIQQWYGTGFPSMQGQVIECQLGPNAAPYYAWTMPTQDAFFIAVGANGSSFKALDAWWTNNAVPNPPTPSPSPRSS